VSTTTRRAVTRAERAVLRDLARRVAEAAALPVMEERRRLWKRHNALDRPRAMILVFPEGSWQELITDADLRCAGQTARRIEYQLRQRIFYHDHLRDDTVIEPTWTVPAVVHSTGWGLWAEYVRSDEPRGAVRWNPPVQRPSDLERLHFPEVIYDADATERNACLAEDLFGDILEVRRKGVAHVSFHLMNTWSHLRGLDNMMLDMVTQPQFVHDAMQFLTEGNRRLVQRYQELNLLSLNNDDTYHSSGGVGYSDELPAQGFEPERVRPCDMWASAESQELAQVSPEMHAEFALRYEKQLLEPFGLNGYGCCEDLTRKLDDVLTIPNIRRISISPFADVERCAERMGKAAIFSWKPHPAHLVGEFDEDRIRRYLRRALQATRGCVFEMVLKDTHTCDHRPERFTRWTEIARELVEAEG